jgi:MraZ protein
MFRGRAVHTIDQKGRLSIPAGFRMELERRSERAPILTNQLQCLALYPYESWREIEKELEEASPLQPEVQALGRFLISGANECPVDKQGRISIPQVLREHAALDKEVMVAGVGRHVEIWDRTRFEQELARTQAQFNEISATVARERRS